MKKNKIFNSILEYILVALLLILSFQKGGFYKNDILMFSLGVTSICFIYIIFRFIISIKNKNYKVDIVGSLLFILPFAYILPIILNNYSDLNDSIFEMIRYFNLYIIYKLVRNSDKKNIYVNTIVIITLVQCLLSIDAISSRYLSNILDSIGSGYLNIDLTRMSGTIQYANVLAILCLISIIFVEKKLKLENKIKFSYVINYIFMFIIASTLILTGSRATLILLFGVVIVYLWYNKEKMFDILLNYVPLTIIVGIYTSIIYSNMICASSSIYLTFYIFCTITLITSFLINLIFKIYSNNEKKIEFKINKMSFILGVLLLIALYLILAFNITKDLKVSSINMQKSENLILNDVKRGENCIKFKVQSKEVDTRYKVTLNSVDKKNEETSIEIFNYFSNTSGEFEYTFDLQNDVKYLKLYIECNKGNLSLTSLYLNDKKQKLDYVFVSRMVIYRINDLLKGSISVTDRVTYYRDAVKIITKTPFNFFFGTGGEGFKNIYEQVKSYDYHSTEVHNSFLQIFVESGIIGFLCILGILIYSLKNSKWGYIKLAFIVLILHSIIDLNFSYMLMIAIFGVLLGLLDYKSEKNINNKLIYFVITIISLVMNICILYILVKVNYAYCINIPKFSDDEISLEKQIEVITKNEKRVMLDPYEYNYKKTLNEQYDVYLELLYQQFENIDNENSKQILENEISNVLMNIQLNADNILKNNKFNKNQILYACSIYFKNLEHFSKLNYSNNVKDGYIYYFNIIIEQFNKLKVIYVNNEEVLKVVENTKKEYIEKFDVKVK